MMMPGGAPEYMSSRLRIPIAGPLENQDFFDFRIQILPTPASVFPLQTDLFKYFIDVCIDWFSLIT